MAEDLLDVFVVQDSHGKVHVAYGASDLRYELGQWIGPPKVVHCRLGQPGAAVYAYSKHRVRSTCGINLTAAHLRRLRALLEPDGTLGLWRRDPDQIQELPHVRGAVPWMPLEFWHENAQYLDEPSAPPEINADGVLESERDGHNAEKLWLLGMSQADERRERAGTVRSDETQALVEESS